MLSGLSDVAMTVMVDVIRFVWRSDDCCVCVTVLIGRLEDPSEGCDLKRFFSNNLTFRLDYLVGQSSGLRQDHLLTYLRD